MQLARNRPGDRRKRCHDVRHCVRKCRDAIELLAQLLLVRVRQLTELCSRQVGREAQAEVCEDAQLRNVSQRLPEQREVALVAR